MSDHPDLFVKSQAEFASTHGQFRLVAMEVEGREHLALVSGDPAKVDRPLVRVQSACLTGTALGALLCDCQAQLEMALSTINAEGAGVFLYLDQEGRGHGLVEKVEHLAEMNAGASTLEACVRRGVPPDKRDYGDAVALVHDLIGSTPVRVLTNNPEKLERLRAAGLEISQRVPLETEPTPTNRDYLRVKKEQMGHLLTVV